jgi:hypothetical protein
VVVEVNIEAVEEVTTDKVENIAVVEVVITDLAIEGATEVAERLEPLLI